MEQIIRKLKTMFKEQIKSLTSIIIVLLMTYSFAGCSKSNTNLEYNNSANRMSLNGDWQFADSTQIKHNNWKTLPVPASWNTFTEYADYIGDAWYQKEVSVPKRWNGKRIFLKFDAVYDVTDVWLNNHYLGQHVGGYTPFEFDVSQYISAGETGTIKLKVNNEHKLGAWYQWGGINRDVYLEAHHELRIVRQKIEPTLDVITKTGYVKLYITVENSSSEAKNITIVGTIKELDDVAFLASGKAKAEGITTFATDIFLNTQQTRMWHFDDPQLYHLETKLLLKGESVAVLKEHFGLRHVDIQPDGMYLNGEKVRLFGYNRVHDHRAYGNTEPLHLVKADIDQMKRSGANFSRIMHAPSAPDLLDYCDKVGYMIWSEIPIWQTVYRTPMNNKEDAEKAKSLYPGRIFTEMVHRDWNHPSIIGWSPGNELRHAADDYVRAMRPLSKKLDPTRFYANIHDQAFGNNPVKGFKFLDNKSVDILFTNKYGKDGAKVKQLKMIHDSIPDMPVFFTEFGQDRDESLNHTVDFTALWEQLGKEPYLIGAAHWTFNDYRSYHKQTPASQNRDWGIVDIWRNPKTFYYQMSKIQQPVKSIDAKIKEQQAEITIQPRGKLELPSFTLRGYSWVYELIDAHGKVLDGSIYKLGDIEPDSEAITRTVKWTASNFKLLVVSLISNNGYTVAESRFNVLTGEKLPLPTFPEAKNPEVRKVLPLDRSFMVGVTSLEGDKGLEVAYGTKAGVYNETLSAPVMGAIRVRDLKNETTYYGRVRRILSEGYSPWSEEFNVTLTEGQVPEPLQILGAVKGDNNIAIRLMVPEKIIGYEVTLVSGKTVKIEQVNPGLIIVPKDSEYVAAINKNGASKKTKI
ncbi:glycoside hydrolase family 2 TIM barrel-domain containing protein [Flavivirga abyssicola]|uniref:glycoside hydrolase family 2 protein n=1 Tax=Flavivirga abyssicola TaxID=3063533 RepID=UPI0026DFD38C|nr:glycoside hydrolase family 2 TIM barrel-domain containing protein [Flavivirga sp. MEBiC07777]WVK13781.1 glycoside hydrolase family 2 TIM barrel-domain containing protein [Flavivirga sp. MEBiC07777]